VGKKDRPPTIARLLLRKGWNERMVLSVVTRYKKFIAGFSIFILRPTRAEKGGEGAVKKCAHPALVEGTGVERHRTKSPKGIEQRVRKNGITWGTFYGPFSLEKPAKGTRGDSGGRTRTKQAKGKRQSGQGREDLPSSYPSRLSSKPERVSRGTNIVL